MDEEDPHKEPLWGETHPFEYWIKVNASHSIEVQEATLFHEAIHAALGVAGLNEILDEKTEEAVVRCLENAFAEIVNVYALGVDSESKS